MASDALTPRHLQIETYYLSEIQHVKNHVLGMLELAIPDWLEEKLADAEDWERLTRSFDGQFQILFGSLELIKPQLGDEMHRQLMSMASDAKTLFLSGDERGAAFKLQDMDELGWSKRSQSRSDSKGTTVAPD